MAVIQKCTLNRHKSPSSLVRGEWQVIEQVRCLRNPFTNLHYDEENFKRLVSMLRSMKDDEFQNVPPFLQNGLREAYDMMPEDLQKRCVKLWKWKV